MTRRRSTRASRRASSPWCRCSARADLSSLLNGNGGDNGGGGVGSGFVLDGNGEIVTNAHVVTSGEGDAIRRARQVYVEFADGNTVQAKILGADPNADVALLKIEPEGADAAPDAARRRATASRSASRSPRSGRRSASASRCRSASSRRSIARSIRSRASASPARSRPTRRSTPATPAARWSTPTAASIGINQQIKTTSGGGEGVGFAVPIDAVKRSLDMLRDSGEAHYAYLGVSSVAALPAARRPLPPRRRQGRVGAGGQLGRPGPEGRHQGRRQRADVPGPVVPHRRRRDHEGRGQAGPGLGAARGRDLAVTSRATRSRSRSTATGTRARSR